jgi:hypothetical protein
MADSEVKRDLVDSFFDTLEKAVGGIENMSGYKEGRWQIDEIIDNDTGAEVFTVTDRRKCFSTSSKEDAEWLLGVLGK